MIDLAGGWEQHAALLRSQAPASAKQLAKQRRRLARGGEHVRYVFDEGDPRALETLLGWKAEQYRRWGRADPLASHRGRELARALARSRQADCTGVVSVLYVGGEPAAIQLSLRSASVLALCIGAYAPRYAPHSPGIILLDEVIRSAADLGVTTVDLGEGDQPYKQAVMTRMTHLPHTVLWRARPTGTTALARLRATAAADDFITARPALRARTRTALHHYGRLRHALHHRSSAPGSPGQAAGERGESVPKRGHAPFHHREPGD
ncbi:GNAT family N-acetyltransferase [Streptomyces sp. CB03911]|uniref:GNAT family N-acetyltransferase n=1 Tax=Streptomyces sp. CB03911 TaxID=1804758 RepID=UPI0018FE4A91|nr:GNAT family N-acetyltransferase [Streptomyces sp. CB03911]